MQSLKLPTGGILTWGTTFKQQSTIKNKKRNTVKRPQNHQKIKHEIKLMFQMDFVHSRPLLSRSSTNFRVFIGAWAKSAKTFKERFNQKALKLCTNIFRNPSIIYKKCIFTSRVQISPAPSHTNGLFMAGSLWIDLQVLLAFFFLVFGRNFLGKSIALCRTLDPSR